MIDAVMVTMHLLIHRAPPHLHDTAAAAVGVGGIRWGCTACFKYTPDRDTNRLWIGLTMQV